MVQECHITTSNLLPPYMEFLCVIRVIRYKSKTETYEELLARARLPTLYNRRLQDIATLMYKVKNNLAPSCLSRLFKTKNSQYCLRNWDFEIPRFNTTGYGKHTIRYQGPYIWSKLSKELRTSPTLARLRQRVSSKTAISGLDVDFT